MFVLIAGGGRTGSQLGMHLINQGHKVHIIEDRPEVVARLHKELPTECIFEGSPADPEVLELAGIARAQVVVAGSSTDAENLAVCYLARTRYQVIRTIGCVNNPSSAWLYDTKFHVDVALNRSEILARLIEEEMSLGDMMTLLKLRKGTFSIVEMKIPEGSPVVGRRLHEINIPQNAVIAAILRKGDLVPPRGNTIFQVGDEVLAISDAESVDEIGEILGSHQKDDFSRWTPPPK